MSILQKLNPNFSFYHPVLISTMRSRLSRCPNAFLDHLSTFAFPVVSNPAIAKKASSGLIQARRSKLT